MRKMMIIFLSILSCACGTSSVTADAMKLEKTEGTAHVTDHNSKEQTLLKR